MSVVMSWGATAQSRFLGGRSPHISKWSFARECDPRGATRLVREADREERRARETRILGL